MSYIIISKGGGGCVGAVGCIYPWLSIIYRRRHPGWNILNISQISTTSLSLPLQVQPRVLLRYHHWRQARRTCRHDIAGRCRAQDGRELSCSLHWSVNPTILGEFRMLLLLVLSSRSNHIIIIQSSSHTLSTYAYSYYYSHHHHVVHRREGIWICRIILPPCHPRFHVPGVREDIVLV